MSLIPAPDEVGNPEKTHRFGVDAVGCVMTSRFRPNSHHHGLNLRPVDGRTNIFCRSSGSVRSKPSTKVLIEQTKPDPVALLLHYQGSLAPNHRHGQLWRE